MADERGNPRLSKIDCPAGSGPRLGLGRAVGAALGAFAGRVHASVAVLRPQSLSRPSGARPSLVWCEPSPHPPRVRRRRRTSCFVSFRRPHPQRLGSTLPVRPPHLPRMRPIGAGTRLPPLRSGRQGAHRRTESVLDSQEGWPFDRWLPRVSRLAPRVSLPRYTHDPRRRNEEAGRRLAASFPPCLRVPWPPVSLATGSG